MTSPATQRRGEYKPPPTRGMWANGSGLASKHLLGNRQRAEQVQRDETRPAPRHRREPRRQPNFNPTMPP